MPGMNIRVTDPTGHTICCRVIHVNDTRKPPDRLAVRVPLARAAGFRHVDTHDPVGAYTTIVAGHEGRDQASNQIYVCTTIERTPAQCSLPG